MGTDAAAVMSEALLVRGISHNAEKAGNCESSIVAIPDETLLQSIALGDSESLIILFRRYSPVVRRVALRALRDEGEAEDLLQDLFLFIFHKAGAYDSEKSSARSWILAMAYQQALQRRRYLKSRNFYHAESLEPERHSNHQGNEDVSLQRIDGRELLRKYRSSLSENQQRVLNLHFFEGQDFHEISELTRQTLPTVRSHYYRALKKLRAEIAKKETQRS